MAWSGFSCHGMGDLVDADPLWQSSHWFAQNE